MTTNFSVMSAICWTSMHTLVTGPLHCRNCGKAFSSPKCELSYRLLPWNPEMENFVGAPTGIEPASPAFRAGVLTTTPQHPGTKCIKFASSNHPWQMVLQHDVITTVFTHCDSAKILLNYISATFFEALWKYLRNSLCSLIYFYHIQLFREP